MKLLNLTLPTTTENLAFDEALLEQAEASDDATGVLRLWESREVAVIVGRSSRVEIEVHRDLCEQRSIPILRRASGGASVVIGPGCLMYSVVLSYESHPELRALDAAHCFVLGKVAAALGRLTEGIELLGTSDLTLHNRKFSGNSLRCKRTHFLYHGTLLYDFPLKLIGQCLRTPPRQPDYRDQRSHDEFITNLDLPVDSLRAALIEEWGASELLGTWSRDRVEQLTRERYSNADWNYRL